MTLSILERTVEIHSTFPKEFPDPMEVLFPGTFDLGSQIADPAGGEEDIGNLEHDDGDLAGPLLLDRTREDQHLGIGRQAFAIHIESLPEDLGIEQGLCPIHEILAEIFNQKHKARFHRKEMFGYHGTILMESHHQNAIMPIIMIRALWIFWVVFIAFSWILYWLEKRWNRW